MNKTPLISPETNKFDLKILLVGNSGGGKTHLCGTYTKGPIHFYMFDYGGEKTLHKLNKDRPTHSPITVDHIDKREKYDKFWTTVQKDERAGFFDYMAEQNGIVVLPDSITGVDAMIATTVAAKNNRDLLADPSKKLGMRIQDWGQISTWLKMLVNVVNSLPCAVISTAHLYSETDKDGAVINRYPAITGQYRSKLGVDFDEVYYLTERTKKRMLYMTNYDKFQAKSRVFSANSIENPTLDMIADAYINNQLTFN